jgi:hypothetical protein
LGLKTATSRFVWQASDFVLLVIAADTDARLAFQYLLLDFMPERIQKPMEPAPWGQNKAMAEVHIHQTFRGPTKDLLKKMRKVDPNQSKRYRQRTGQ